ncbi:hypothetical protein [Jannaschia sp. R86511]|uniref:hypothetical protein n=1 Tax=Jannaschia sp. R86511 TaxID=3093853 RepID=UPI0036D283F1
MIGQLPGRVVVAGIIGFVVVLVALGAMSLDDVVQPGPYLLALALGLTSVVAVLLPWPPGREAWAAAGVVAAVVVLGLLVVSVLPDGRPGYALWFPAFVWIPLSGLALRGRPVAALVGTVLSAATTIGWAYLEPGVGLDDGLYRVVSPTAAVVVAVGIQRLVRQYGEEVDRAHAEQLEAARLSAGARAAEEERRSRLARIELEAAPVLRRLRDGGPVDDRLATECRLLEAALRDGIRGRHLVDPAVRETLWSARTRGVQVTLLDDSGVEPGGSPPAVADAVRRCTVELVERLERGVVTIRLAGPTEATLVAITPQAAEVAAACRAGLAAHRELDVRVEVEHHDEAADELLVTVRPAPRPTTPPPGTPAASATGRG